LIKECSAIAQKLLLIHVPSPMVIFELIFRASMYAYVEKKNGEGNTPSFTWPENSITPEPAVCSG
jgi:hypothetical protein